MTARNSPRIEALVVNAIRRLQDVQGSTSKEISNYISQEYNVPAPKVKKHVNMALRRGLSFGILHRSKGGYYSCGDQDIRNGPMEAAEVILKRGRRGCKRHSSRRRRKRRSRRSRHGRCKSRRRRRKSCRRPRKKSCRRARRHRRACKSKSRRRRRRRKMGKCCDGDAGDREAFFGGRGPRNDSFAGTIKGSGGSSGSDMSSERHAAEVAPGQDVSPISGNCLD